MKYVIDISRRKEGIISVEYIIPAFENEITVVLPAWRPGRYEKANYAKNLYPVKAKNKAGEILPIEKTHTNQWKISNPNSEEVKVCYSYYARQMDAGGSWLDEELIYINFINCLLYVPQRQDEACEIELDLPSEYQIACGIPFTNGRLTAKNYIEITDSPLLAAKELQHKSYSYQGTTYHLWLCGNCCPDWPAIIEDFRNFTKVQVDVMGSFPEHHYHFLYIILPYRHYHGVEHRNSTVITLGPAEDFHENTFYENFLGISSHELFHSWNVCKIRPAEMMPYDLSKENYFRTGYIAEGVTTYYGDLFLKRSGVFNTQQYLNEINKLLKRHAYNYSRASLSLAESSFDLWIDGYNQGIPDRKVSIYEKGALMALLLDLKIRKHTNGQKSMDDVMRFLWEEYGKKNKGYTPDDYQSAIEKISGLSMDEYFTKYITGTEPFETELNHLLNFTGLELKENKADKKAERLFGLKVTEDSAKAVVEIVLPGSPSAEIFNKGDEIIAINGKKINNNLEKLIKDKEKNTIHFFRNNILMSKEILAGSEIYFSWFSLNFLENMNNTQKENLINWLGPT